ncbi:Zinc-finger domain of monoamine-oxidase A repressor R1 [Rhynchospora pubera]|uniref:Zinc-finger domain of monoamine-oxidase A repressor R1 n=1 Tax=Rhynchospora pubera TaxID=906938 RepID=A0AAV8D3N7_9POAL|nr:Zinc-finger domain of monoamine-oxidase A repressor R1 [Rhynchospora pubera]
MAKGMKSGAEVEIAPLNPDTPQKAIESARAKRARSPPLTKSEAMEEATVDYEKYREERIKANMERMQKLGLLDLSRDVKGAFSTSSSTNPKRRALLSRNGSKEKVDLNPLLPPRRSSRLQNVMPVDYTEAHGKKNHDSVESIKELIEEGRREEFYTEEHEKLLGSCEMPWTLFEDGYDKDGKRIYDQVKGKTCHQCRQKTMGYRTSCCKCQLVQGQFCGDCLYMRYGENVLEAIKNPDWICPACRGICNCSFCRLKKGWNPTGCLYKKVVNLGYKSVAHYLILTRRKPENSGSESAASMAENKEAAKENQPKPEILSEKSDKSTIMVGSPDENDPTCDGESLTKHRQVKKEKRNKEAAKENQPKSEILSEKSDKSTIIVGSPDENGPTSDGESLRKHRRVKKEKEKGQCGNVTPGSIASRLRSGSIANRLRSRQKKA